MAKLEESELYRPHWWDWDRQKQEILRISVELYITYENKSYDECIVEAKGMVDTFHSMVMNAKTRKW